MAHLVLRKTSADGSVDADSGSSGDEQLMKRFYSRSTANDYLNQLTPEGAENSQAPYRIAVVEGLELQTLPLGGKAWVAREPDVPGFYTVISNLDESGLPVDPEKDALAFKVLDADTNICVSKSVLNGREGLNAWHLRTVGYAPDLEGDGIVPIEEIIDSVGVHMIFTVSGLD